MTSSQRRSGLQGNYSAFSGNSGHKIKVVGYCRVSTDRQAQDGLSLEAQRAEILRYASAYGWAVERIFVDGGYSGKNTDRPAFQEMVKTVRGSDGGISVIVVAKLDRLTRSLRDVCAIIEDLLDPCDCSLVAIRDGINTSQIAFKMLLPILAAIGQMERQNAAERTKASIDHIKSQGYHYGKVPFGYAVERIGRYRKLFPCPIYHPWLEKIIAWHKEGVTYMQIAKRLNLAGVKAYYGHREWTNKKIYELLRTMKLLVVRHTGSAARYDKTEAHQIASKMRDAGHTHSEIAHALNHAGLRPKCAPEYRLNSVEWLLRSVSIQDRSTPRGLALYLKEKGYSYREIARQLAEHGFHPKRGGQWYAQSVRVLMVG